MQIRELFMLIPTRKESWRTPEPNRIGSSQNSRVSAPAYQSVSWIFLESQTSESTDLFQVDKVPHLTSCRGYCTNALNTGAEA